MQSTLLKPGDRLPLTCTRAGTCCHGKAVWINPWELAGLARGRGIEPRAFRDDFTEAGGIRLTFDGAPGWQGQPACSQYDPASGCVVHAHRPLACRLYPLGRERRGDQMRYVHRGKRFPCLEGCPEVVKLPRLTVADYLEGQEVVAGELAQDGYLELVQDLGEGAFVLLLETGLSASGDQETLPRWRALGRLGARERVDLIPDDWLDRLTIPPLPWSAFDPTGFVKAHGALLERETQAAFGALSDFDAIREASCQMLALALHLAQSVGADTVSLAEHWARTARANGARG